MKIEKTSVNCAIIDIEREHTHTTFYSVAKDSIEPFKEVHINYSPFPKAIGIGVHTFDDGSIYIEIPQKIDIKIRLNTHGSEQKPKEI